MGATNDKIKIECTEEQEIMIVTCELTHTVVKDAYAYSIYTKYGMTLKELKQCNKNTKGINGKLVLPNGVEGDFVLNVGDVLNVKGKAISARVVKGGDIKESKSSSCAPWMKIVLREKGVRRNGDDTKNKGNKRIMEFHDTTTLYQELENKGDYDAKQSWCGSFVNWIMLKSGHKTVEKSFRAINWKQFGRRIDSPVYGAIGVKTRKGGAHVSFVIGISEDGKDIFMLGGNQGDPHMVEVKRYSLNTWNEGFYFPHGYDATKCTLEVYRSYALPKGGGD